MGGQFNHSGGSSRFHYERNISNFNSTRKDADKKELQNKKYERDDDLIIEDNTIYEIDRECYERLRKQKKWR